MSTTPKLTPMMQQWHECKQAAGDAVLLFRMGDFYEAFHDDAPIFSRELELTLTQRQGIPMAGIPVSTCAAYVDRMVAKGYRVAIAEQLEDPKQTKGIVKRGVTRVVTPGTVIDSSLLSDKSNNYIASIAQVGKTYGLAFLDLTTGEFDTIELTSLHELQNELHRVHPSEIVTSETFYNKQDAMFRDLLASYQFLTSTIESWRYDHASACGILNDHFGTHSLDGFGLGGMVAGTNAAGGLLYYLRDRLCQSIDHVRTIGTYNISQYVALDRITMRNLELTRNLHEGSRRNTLLDTLDRTCTSMGGRLLRHWIVQPLLDVDAIVCRQDAIAAFHEQRGVTDTFRQLLDGVRDLERLSMKVSSGLAAPRDLVGLRISLEALPGITQTLAAITSQAVSDQMLRIPDLSSVAALIAQSICDEPPLRVSDGGVIRDGVNSELDDLRTIRRDGKAWITNYQQQLRDQLDIRTLKVGFNRMSGYYIEVSRGQSNRMPDTFQRRQTLANNERFLSPELKEYEQKVLTAEDRITNIEAELYRAVRTEVATFCDKITTTAQALAHLDCLCGLAVVARDHGYIRPTVDNGTEILLEDGRHPVLDANTANEPFIPNSTLLNNSKSRLHIITGPNMAGKSTYIRQVALLVIMAQMGSFIPARNARIGITDKVFTRIGASDDLSRGQSTFMVEMTETANILNNATDRSLVILDEIGRGTSTYDGISIAWAVAEHLLTIPGKQARTLFATHYFELTRIEEAIEGAVNYNVAVQELDDDIRFLRKIVRGSADRSYGIHVGRLAGLPEAVVHRAKSLLSDLENQAKLGHNATVHPRQRRRVVTSSEESNVQLMLFEPQT
ncbi:DNA mismatch repair protein MutS [Chlamydiales bacterium SCGC AG-110-P3]|nr:DNA mismatch repair protein MutS [Chlamydiales bacterium SCGC AG-110-P3]